MTRILNAEPEGYSDEARAELGRVGEVVDGPLSRAELIAAMPDVDVLIVRLGHNVDREVLDAAPRLRAVVTATTGLDHVDVEHAAARGVEVLSLRGETELLRTVHATAEHTWALLLALVRRIPAAFASVRAGRWDRDRFRGRELAGKRLCIVGLGRVGRQVAGYGLAFGMDVAGHDPHAVDWPDGVARADGLPAALSRADVLTVHVPLRAGTAGLIGAAELAMLPPGAVVVNTSRGEVLDEAALVAALASGRVAGAAVDVIAGERDEERRRRSPLLEYAGEHENVIVTPHLGGATAESMARTELVMACKLAAFLEGSRARRVDPVPGRGI